MWEQIRKTILILLLGSLIGILLGYYGSSRVAKRGDHEATATVSHDTYIQEISGTATHSPETSVQTASRLEEQGIKEEFVENGEADGAQENERERLGINDDSIRQVMAEQAGYYYYDTMEPENRVLYAELLMILRAHGERTPVSVTDADVLSETFLRVYRDHPEIYWYDGYSYSLYMGEDERYGYCFGGMYTYTAEECVTLDLHIRQYVDSCLRGMPTGTDEYAKEKYFYEYIIRNTDYDPASRDNQNILSVFLYGSSVCQGYARALQYLCQCCGIQAAVAVGEVNYGEGHAWDLVRINGAYYYVDPTWGDGVYLPSEYGNGNAEEVNYNYLNVTTQDIAATHTVDELLPMPLCNSLDANYFVREGLYFTAYDEAAFEELFLKAHSDGTHRVAFRLSDDAVYMDCRERLIGDAQEIFRYLPADVESLDFTENTRMHIMSFWF